MARGKPRPRRPFDRLIAPSKNGPAMTDVAVARTMSGDRVGAVASFPYDRATVERFKQTFPRARWVEDDKSWFVPGVTAARRLDRWLARDV